MSGIVHVYQIYALILDRIAVSGVHLLSDVFQEYPKDVCTESEVPELALPQSSQMGCI